ncbi:MAG: thioesterase family protein [Pseudomonadota bacterium]
MTDHDKNQHYWPVQDPFIVQRRARAGDIDAFGHVNNLRYVEWALDVAWAHSDALGVAFADYERIGAGFVVQRHEFDYKRPVKIGEDVLIATWIAENDGRVRLARAYEMRFAQDGALVLRGLTRFVTIDMASGKPRRMPELFKEAYRIAPPV